MKKQYGLRKLHFVVISIVVVTSAVLVFTYTDSLSSVFSSKVELPTIPYEGLVIGESMNTTMGGITDSSFTLYVFGKQLSKDVIEVEWIAGDSREKYTVNLKTREEQRGNRSETYTILWLDPNVLDVGSTINLGYGRFTVISTNAKVSLPDIGDGIVIETFKLQSRTNNYLLIKYYDKVTGLLVKSETDLSTIDPSSLKLTTLISDTGKDSNNDGITDLQHLLEFRTNPLQ